MQRAPSGPQAVVGALCAGREGAGGLLASSDVGLAGKVVDAESATGSNGVDPSAGNTPDVAAGAAASETRYGISGDPVVVGADPRLHDEAHKKEMQAARTCSRASNSRRTVARSTFLHHGVSYMSLGAIPDLLCLTTLGPPGFAASFFFSRSLPKHAEHALRSKRMLPLPRTPPGPRRPRRATTLPIPAMPPAPAMAPAHPPTRSRATGPRAERPVCRAVLQAAARAPRAASPDGAWPREKRAAACRGSARRAHAGRAERPAKLAVAARSARPRAPGATAVAALPAAPQGRPAARATSAPEITSTATRPSSVSRAPRAECRGLRAATALDATATAAATPACARRTALPAPTPTRTGERAQRGVAADAARSISLAATPPASPVSTASSRTDRPPPPACLAARTGSRVAKAPRATTGRGATVGRASRAGRKTNRAVRATSARHRFAATETSARR